ncbi:hypothetical protein QEZ47_07495 [Aminobacter anthyllidis]|uniref:hypothetical protein n=1 Tax=Aminobacter anthyllidis TaxID=1035067 RepID=UPI002455539B|nr:hypothetical protein [Aminobacter anthyllidis]MDH4985387.1 hypothetical protein [Aminobacter anthyllidis]
MAPIPARSQASDDLIHRDEGIAEPLHLADKQVEELGRYRQMTIGAIRPVKESSDPVQHEDDADAAHQRPGQGAKTTISDQQESQLSGYVDHSFTFGA